MSPSANEVLAGTAIAALQACGVRLALVAPGSRSTPLVAALQTAGFPMRSVLDERAAAFAAVGCARVGELAAVVTTSGTAVANLLPGLAEAERDELPVVALTADRRGDEVRVRANQTLDQPPLLAGVARGRLDLDAEQLPPDWRDQLLAALAALGGPSPGPVHLNLRFDKPLEPTGAAGVPMGMAAPAPLVRQVPDPPWLGAERGLVVVGALPFAAREGVSRLLDGLPWPALVDVTSGLARDGARRFRPALVRLAEARAGLAPDRVLWVGGRVTEPAVGAWLSGAEVEIVQWRAGDALRESDGIRPRACTVDFAGSLPDPAGATPSALDLNPLDAAFPVPPQELTEPAIARTVAESVGPGQLLFVGSSMPIRDVDRFVRRLAAPVLANRGVSGIDGNLATAFGAHVASGRPVTVLLGDLAFLHDVGTLGLLAQADASVRIVCVNNDGGGIFHFLPIAGHPEVLEPWLTAPHGLDPVAIAQGFGVPARRLDSMASLEEAVMEPPRGPELLELRTDRSANLELHRRLDARYRESLR